jgi:phage gpG-like protein
MFASLTGAETLDLDLATLPANILAQLEGKARDLAAALAAKVRDEKLSGQLLATRTGALKASILADVSVEDGQVQATVGSFGDVKYAAIQECGGRTAAHEIVPDKALALAFIVGGALRFARRVEHPGSTLPARAYLGSSLEEAREDIVDAFAAVATQAWEDR